MSIGRQSILDAVRLVVQEHLEQISRFLPDGYVLTFVARHGGDEDAGVCITEEESLDRVIRTVEILRERGRQPGPLNQG